MLVSSLLISLHLTEMIVCSRSSCECMIQRCDNCPGLEPLRSHLQLEFEKISSKHPDVDSDDAGWGTSSGGEEDEEEEQEVRFSQWVSTDRPDIVKQRLPVTEFIELLVGKVDDLTSHSFTAKLKGSMLKKSKKIWSMVNLLSLVILQKIINLLSKMKFRVIIGIRKVVPCTLSWYITGEGKTIWSKVHPLSTNQMTWTMTTTLFIKFWNKLYPTFKLILKLKLKK